MKAQLPSRRGFVAALVGTAAIKSATTLLLMAHTQSLTPTHVLPRRRTSIESTNFSSITTYSYDVDGSRSALPGPKCHVYDSLGRRS